MITIPTRHIHCHVGLLSLKDTENAIRIVIELLKKLNGDKLKASLSFNPFFGVIFQKFIPVYL